MKKNLKLKKINIVLIFSCDKPEEQIKVFEYIEKNVLYGFHKDLNAAYKKKYSSQALERVLKKIY